MSETIVSSTDPLQRIAEAYQDLGRRLAVSDADPLASITSTAVVHVPGVDWASVTVATRQGGFRTAAATDDRARQADQVQYDLGSGPCVDAATDGTIYCPQDIAHDERWPDFGKRVSEEFGVGSMLAFRLALDGGELLGALNLYATARHAFDDRSIMVGELIAVHAASRVGLVLARTSNVQLTGALASNRDIGVAMGVLMQRHKLTREQAFDLLRVASQNSNRKLRDIAVEVGDVGELQELRRP